jgi:putative ABC transport system substrate-binding protein
MATEIGRRKFIAVLSAATAWPTAARAQQSTLPVVGLLSSLLPERQTPLTHAFLQGLSEAGYIEGRNVIIEYRWARGQYDRLPALAADLVRRQVNVIAAVAGSAPCLAAKAATSTIPIVFQTGSDPIKDGLVSSMNRPGGNVTGVTRLGTTVEPKRLELLHQLVPKATAITFIVNPTNPAADGQLQEMQRAAHSLSLHLDVMKASTEREVDTAFATLAQQGASALLIATDPLLGDDKFVALAARYKVPVGYFNRTQVAAGGLISYGASLEDTWRQVGVYTGRVLKGERPGDLPVLQPTKFELAINLATAKALGLVIPDKLLALADEIIE